MYSGIDLEDNKLADFDIGQANTEKVNIGLVGIELDNLCKEFVELHMEDFELEDLRTELSALEAGSLSLADSEPVDLAVHLN